MKGTRRRDASGHDLYDVTHENSTSESRIQQGRRNVVTGGRDEGVRERSLSRGRKGKGDTYLRLTATPTSLGLATGERRRGRGAAVCEEEETMLRNEIDWFDMDTNSTGSLTSTLAADATLEETTPRLTLELSPWPNEAITNINTVVAFGYEDMITKQFSSEPRRSNKKALLRAHITAIGFGTSHCLAYFSYALGLWYSSKLIKNKESNFGDTLKTFIVLIFTATTIAEAFGVAPDIVKCTKALESVFNILERRTEIEPEDSISL
ncbi:hypothetical protein Sjap_021606 [Stephania japonica]|uniref:ABC transmembrane type-1 domain-containing protein n=1 Tax=Stephania japonica TaxID=461633 RepID=A0AAP0EMP4_9MAGN